MSYEHSSRHQAHAERGTEEPAARSRRRLISGKGRQTRGAASFHGSHDPNWADRRPALGEESRVGQRAEVLVETRPRPTFRYRAMLGSSMTRARSSIRPFHVQRGRGQEAWRRWQSYSRKHFARALPLRLDARSRDETIPKP